MRISEMKLMRGCIATADEDEKGKGVAMALSSRDVRLRVQP